MPRKFLWQFGPAWAPEGESAPAPAADPATEAAPPAEATPPAGAAPGGNGSLIPPAEGEAPKPPAEGEAAPAVEPLKIEDLKLPEGISAEDPALAKLVETLGNADLKPAERAQALLDNYREAATKVAEATSAHLAAEYKKINDAWIAEAKADPVISKPEAMGVVAKALDTYGNGPELRKAFALTGAGNNPHVIRLIHTMAAQLAEGRPAQGGTPAGKKSAAEIFYGTPPLQA